MNFSVIGEIPGKIILISPDGTQETNPVTFKWQADSAATGYHLKIINSGNIVYETSLGQVTSFTLSSQSLSVGNYSWQVQGTLNGEGGPWSDAKLFSITSSGQVPGAVSLISPSGKTTLPVTYQWKEDPYATQYRIWLEGDFTAGGEWGQWLDANLICESGICSFSAKLLREGSYSWKVQAQNEFGVGPESKTFTFTIYFK